ncbi:hypothetical protein HPP92_018213 [Vanilla planifolia]|uniref:Uncharacterized protein n=1 Tax=Vanilla planifolia TaxID=51239 RepID=A0A835QDY3_VANPL|nr:hypothetical protein HPP92_018213 [Vanilla planifolia]
MRFYRNKMRHALPTQAKQKFALDSCRYLQQECFYVTYLPVRPDTGLASIMAFNNEIGVEQPLEEEGSEVAVCSGSACTSASLEPSEVLRAPGVDEGMVHTSVRFGIGRLQRKQRFIWR